MPHQRIIKEINAYRSLSERRAACKLLLDNEIKLLKEQAYNPVNGAIVKKEDFQYEIDPNTEFSKALDIARNNLNIEKVLGSI